MTLIEKMTRATWVKVQEQIPEKVRMTDWDAVPDEVKKNFTDFVRAALEAMRIENVVYNVEGRPNASPFDIEWNRRIDAALKEQP